VVMVVIVLREIDGMEEEMKVKYKSSLSLKLLKAEGG